MLRYALVTVLFATPAMADTVRYGHMMDWGHGHGFGMFFGPVLWILILGLVVAGIVWLARRLDHGMREQVASNKD